MQTAVRATCDQDWPAAWGTLSNIFGFLGEDEPLLAGVAARAYRLRDLERSWTIQRKIKISRSVEQLTACASRQSWK